MLRDLQALEQHARRGAVRDRRHPHRRRAGDVPRRRVVAAGAGALAMLAHRRPHFTTEVGAFNLELNLDPQEFTGDCLSALEASSTSCSPWPGAAPTGRAQRRADRHPADDPQGRPGLDNMVQNPRYLALNTAPDETCAARPTSCTSRAPTSCARQDSVMAEACNASFQVHLQVTPDEFVNLYNVAQVLAGPVLACATNSPLLFGKRLWAETRIALFEQSVDTRRPGHHLRERSAAGHVRQPTGCDVVDRRAVQGGHHPVPAGARARRLRRPVRRARRGSDPDARRRCGCTPARCGAGTGAATASPTACRTCASRTACCRRGRA